jgi:hypothetical protein
MGEGLSYLALRCWYDINFPKALNLPSASDQHQNTCRDHLLRLQHCQDTLFCCPDSQQVAQLGATHVPAVCRSERFTSLSNASEYMKIPPDWPAIPCTNRRGLRTGSYLTGTSIRSKCSHWQFNNYTSECTVVLPSTISLPYFYSASVTSLDGRIYRCQQRDDAWIV